jgi:hypothetical protein
VIALLARAQGQLQWAASLVFVAAFYFISVRKDNQVILSTHFALVETLILIALSALALPQIYRRSRRTLVVLIVIGGTLALLQLPYLVFYHSRPIAGHTMDYVVAFGRLYVYLLAICSYGLFFYEDRILSDLFWRVGQLVLLVSLVAYFIYEAARVSYLLQFYGAEARIQGFFSEPSAFAPMLAAFILLCLKKKAFVWMLVALFAVLLTGSPTVYLTVAVSVPIVVLIRREEMGKRIVVATAALSLCVVCALVVGDVELQALLRSKLGLAYSVGRLLSGLQNIATLGGSGQNVRFADALIVYQTLRDHGLFLTGYGLNSSSVYFLLRYGDAKDHSLFLTVLFSYGLPGLLAFVFLCASSLVGLVKNHSSYLYVFVPFLVAASINSAEGFETYKFVLLGMVIYWLRKDQWVPASGRKDSNGAVIGVTSPHTAESG